MLTDTFFNSIFIFPFINLMLLIYKGFLFIKLPFAFGFSIIALTALVRLVFHPLFHRQYVMAKKMEKLKPRLDELSKKHEKDKKKLQEEQMKLYKEAGVNPLSGCLPALVQIPIFWALYRVFTLFFQTTDIKKLIVDINHIVYTDFLKLSSINTWFFGINLITPPSHYQKAGWWYLLIPLVTALLQYLQTRASSSYMPSAGALSKTTSEKKESSSDMSRMMNTQMKVIFPLMIGYFSYILPAGLSLYWNIFSLFSILAATKKIDV